ncbi:MAG TPA: HdeD family acid-resistance protein [Gammaproteobacteria bacterium]|nr:HdeD family acid-resistance protein [Gammaproteobacteria bacterium]
MSTTADMHGDFAAADVHDVRPKWGWYVALGILFLVLGFVALGDLFIATLASVFYIGALMMVGAVCQLIHAFQVKRWSGFAFWLLAAILYGFAGYFAFTNPLFAAGVLTLFLGIALVVSGVLRIAAAMQWSSARGRGWVIAAGVIAVLAGLLVIFRWPQATPWLLGLFLAIDLTFFGASEIAFGLMLKAAGRERASPAAPATPAP